MNNIFADPIFLYRVGLCGQPGRGEQQQDRLPGDDEEPMAVPSPSPLQRGKSGILSTPEREGRFPETQKVSSPVVSKRLEEHFEEGKVSKTLPPCPVALPKPAPQQMPPPAGPPPLSQGAIDRRIRRAMEPTAKGEFKVSSEVRKLWEEGSREKVFRLFADCGNDTDTFVKRHSVKKEHEKETELGVYFTFLTESQFGDRSEKLRWISCWIFPAMLQTFQMNIAYCSKQTICVFLRCYRKEKKNIIARAKANPKKMMRSAYWSPKLQNQERFGSCLHLLSGLGST